MLGCPVYCATSDTTSVDRPPDGDLSTEHQLIDPASPADSQSALIHMLSDRIRELRELALQDEDGELPITKESAKGLAEVAITTLGYLCQCGVAATPAIFSRSNGAAVYHLRNNSNGAVMTIEVSPDGKMLKLIMAFASATVGPLNVENRPALLASFINRFSLPDSVENEFSLIY